MPEQAPDLNKKKLIGSIKPPFSVSRINACDACRFKAYKKYVEKSPEEFNPVASTGKSIHAGIEMYSKHCYENNMEWEDEMANETIRKLRGEIAIDDWYPIESIFSHFMHSIRFPVGHRQLIEWAFAVNKQWEPVDFEAPEAYFRGRIDFAYFINDTEMEIWDYKTGFKVNTVKTPSVMFQLRCYALMVKIHFPQVQKITIVNKYIRFNIDISEDVDMDNLDSLKEFINDKIRDIMADTEFMPKIQDECRLCSYQKVCEVFIKHLSQDMPTMLKTAEDAKKLASKIYTAELDLKKMKRAMKLYINKTGATIPIGKDLAYSKTYVPRRSFETNVAGLVKYLVDMGCDKSTVWSNLKIGRDEINKILFKSKKMSLMDEIVKKFSKKEYSEKWDIEKIEAEAPIE